MSNISKQMCHHMYVPSHSGYSMIHCPSLSHTANPGSAAKYPLRHLNVAVLCVYDGVALYVTT